MNNQEKDNMASLFGKTSECEPIDELSVLLEGRRGAELQRSAQAHVDACAHCQAELALLHEFEAPTIRPEEKPHVDAIVARLRKNSPAAGAPWWKRIWSVRVMTPAVAGLAIALLAVTVGIELRNPTAPPPTPDSSEVKRSQSVESLSPVGELERAPEDLKWHAVEGAVHYHVRLLEVDRTELWSATVSSSQVALPAGIRAGILPMKTLEWDVKALDATGNVIANSGLQQFRLQSAVSR